MNASKLESAISHVPFTVSGGKTNIETVLENVMDFTLKFSMSPPVPHPNPPTPPACARKPGQHRNKLIPDGR